jgi:hypothetical protein
VCRPACAIDAAQRAAHACADRATYAATVLGRPVGAATPVEYLHLGGPAIALGLPNTVGAVA